MKPVAEGERIVANIYETEFEPYIGRDGETDGFALQLDRSKPLGTGFHVYKMEPGYTTIPHEHGHDEEFLVISGDVTDNDGTVYREGDLVLMKAGTQHCSHTENGCVIAVYIEPGEDAFKPV
jgi:quercetin dioxygenase-like cupin family protein